MKKIFASILAGVFLAWVCIGGTVQGQTSGTPTPTATSTPSATALPSATPTSTGPQPPPPPGPPPASTPVFVPPPAPCPPNGCPTATLTATPMPTATSTPVPVVLSVKVGHRTVNPRSKQAITITTNPSANVYVGVRYPNGDTFEYVGNADTSGAAKVTYTQPGSRITHTSRTAKVTVEVSLGFETTSKTVRYTIGYARLDISAEPRTVNRGKAVTLWAHTAPRTRVAATIRYKSGTVAFNSVLGVTGSNGWTSHRWTVPAKAKTGPADVKASARIGGKTPVGAETSLRIR